MSGIRVKQYGITVMFFSIEVLSFWVFNSRCSDVFNYTQNLCLYKLNCWFKITYQLYQTWFVNTENLCCIELHVSRYSINNQAHKTLSFMHTITVHNSTLFSIPRHIHSTDLTRYKTSLTGMVKSLLPSGFYYGFGVPYRFSLSLNSHSSVWYSVSNFVGDACIVTGSALQACVIGMNEPKTIHRIHNTIECTITACFIVFIVCATHPSISLLVLFESGFPSISLQQLPLSALLFYDIFPRH